MSIRFEVPERGAYAIEHLVLDVNGTLALDGHLLPGVLERVRKLRRHVAIHLLTADTHGRSRLIAQELGLTMERVASAAEKAGYVRGLGPERVVAVGNGANDAVMLREAALGIAVLGPEGLALEALLAADLVVPDIAAALDLLLHPDRIVATLRR